MVVGLVYRTGRFGAGDTLFVWAILAGFSLGLLAATQARLFSSAFYALGDTRTPVPHRRRPGVLRHRRWGRAWPSWCRRCCTWSRAGAWSGWPPPAASPPGSSSSCCAGSWPGGWARPSPCPARVLALLLLAGALAAAGGFATKYLLAQAPPPPASRPGRRAGAGRVRAALPVDRRPAAHPRGAGAAGTVRPAAAPVKRAFTRTAAAALALSFSPAARAQAGRRLVGSGQGPALRGQRHAGPRRLRSCVPAHLLPHRRACSPAAAWPSPPAPPRRSPTATRAATPP